MTDAVKPRIHPEWKTQLEEAFQAESFARLKTFLLEERAQGRKVFPPGPRMFAAFDLTPWSKVKVVILGQDPYHGPGQANGLSFSVNPGVALPPSLRNIYQELETDLGIAPPSTGDLQPWAEQGVLMLNATLSVRAHEAGSHQKRGWEPFTDAVVAKLNDHPNRLVFILWGSYARKKAEVIDRNRHFVIESPHPSPLSAHRRFFGSRPFSRTNAKLQEWGVEPIQWVVGNHG
jgi:uracil-DNA glycosylase